MNTASRIARSLTAVAILLTLLQSNTADALTTRTLTIDAASYDADGYTASEGSIIVTHTISDAQSSGTLTFNSADSSVCTIAQKINSGVRSRTEAVVTFLRGGNCTLTISVAATSTYSDATDTVTFPLSDPGSVVMWGSSINPPRYYSGDLAGLTVTDIDTGGAGMTRTTCAIADGRVFCWGENADGQLGINSSTDSTLPVAVHTVSDGTGSALPDDAEIRSVSVSVSAHVCVTAMPAGGTSDSDMRAYCWGRNTYGQLGNGNTTSSPVPVEVDDCNCGATIISAGYDHTCAVIGGHAACWGYGSAGQLGDGLTADISVPTYVAETGDGDRGGVTSALPTGAEITAIEAGGDASCAIADGRAYCWGQNTNGRLGDGTTTTRLVPIAVDTSTGMTGTVTDIALGGRHNMNGAHLDSWMFTCAVAGGDAWCWGADNHDTIGNGSSGGGYRPIAVHRQSQSGELPDDAVVTSIDAGWRHACLTADGIAYCWGSSGAYSISPTAVSTAVGSALRSSLITKVSVTGAQSGTSYLDTNAALREFIRSEQTITFPGPATVDHTTTSVDLSGTATASSGLSVLLSVSPPEVCTITDEMITVISHGSCLITANQSGDGEWVPAPSVTRTLTITGPTTTTSSTTSSSTTSTSSTSSTSIAPVSPTSSTMPTDDSTDASEPQDSQAPTATTTSSTSTSTSTAPSSPAAESARALLVVEGSDGSTGVMVATDSSNRVVGSDGNGYRLPGGSVIEIVAGPYESTAVTAQLVPESGDPIAAELERLSRACHLRVVLPEDATGNWLLEVVVDGVVVISVPVTAVDDVVDTPPANVDAALISTALRSVIALIEAGDDVAGITPTVDQALSAEVAEEPSARLPVTGRATWWTLIAALSTAMGGTLLVASKRR